MLDYFKDTPANTELPEAQLKCDSNDVSLIGKKLGKCESNRIKNTESNLIRNCKSNRIKNCMSNQIRNSESNPVGNIESNQDIKGSQHVNDNANDGASKEYLTDPDTAVERSRKS